MTEFPLGLPGRVFGSPMPFGAYDREGKVFSELKRNDISAVVLLAEDHECILENPQRNLSSLYAENGLQIIHLPIPNYGITSVRALETSVDTTIAHAQTQRHALIHCSAGLGRTALFLTFLAMKVLNLPGREAINWVGHDHPRALLTPIQIELILSQSS